jgi:hypothetical protein
MLNRFSCIFLAVTISVGLLSGCGGAATSNAGNNSVNPQPSYQRVLPISGAVVYFTQGEHTWDNNPGILSSIDVAPSSDSENAVAPVSGNIIAMGNEKDRNDVLHSIVKIQESSTDMIFEVMHIDKYSGDISVGKTVKARDVIGKPSLEVPKGGSTTGVHIHLTLRDKNGNPIAIKGYEFSGWKVDGKNMTKQGEATRIENTIHTNSGINRNDLTQDFGKAVIGASSIGSSTLNQGRQPFKKNPEDLYRSLITTPFGKDLPSGMTIIGSPIAFPDISKMTAGSSPFSAGTLMIQIDDEQSNSVKGRNVPNIVATLIVQSNNQSAAAVYAKTAEANEGTKAIKDFPYDSKLTSSTGGYSLNACIENVNLSIGVYGVDMKVVEQRTIDLTKAMLKHLQNIGN